MSDNLQATPRWGKARPPVSLPLRVKERHGMSRTGALRRAARVEREAIQLVEDMVAVGEVARAAALVAQLNSKLEAFVPCVPSAAAAEAQADAAEDVAQINYHLHPTTENAHAFHPLLGWRPPSHRTIDWRAPARSPGGLMHWLAWMLIGMWFVPVPGLWYIARRDTVAAKRTWHTGWAALIWPVILVFVSVVAVIGSGKRMWP